MRRAPGQCKSVDGLAFLKKELYHSLAYLRNTISKGERQDMAP